MAAAGAAGCDFDELGDSQAGREAMESTALACVRGGGLRDYSLLVAGEARGIEPAESDSGAGGLAGGKAGTGVESAKENAGGCSLAFRRTEPRLCELPCQVEGWPPELIGE